MKKAYKIIVLFLVFATVILSCNKEEKIYIDPMIDGVCSTVEESLSELAAGNWSGALVGFRTQRIKLLGMKELIETDGYTRDGYTLENSTEAAQRVAEALALAEFKLDSVWSANILSEYNAIDENSAGVSNFGASAYANTGVEIGSVYSWLMEENEEVSETKFIPNELDALQASVAVLTGLAALNENEVIEYVNNLKVKFEEMKQQYADLASEVSSSPYFSKGQKDLYTSLQAPLDAMETTINVQITLSTREELDAIDRDLYPLVYFVNNNYTSPAQRPLVWGKISSITELRWMSEVATKEELTGDWAITADIDAAETARWNQDAADGLKGFRAINKPLVNFNLDGQFHIISGLTMIHSVGGLKTGMFTDITNGSIKNLGLYNVSVFNVTTGSGQGGILAGWLRGSISKVWIHGKQDVLRTQSGALVGRCTNTAITDCFTNVDIKAPNAARWTSTFIGIPDGTLSLTNCYNANTTDRTDSWLAVWFGYPAGINVTSASGLYYDSQTQGSTKLVTLEQGSSYSESTVVKLEDTGVVTDLPSAQWGTLSNFGGFSSDVWEIKTISEIDALPRPYLKGFNYQGLENMITP